MTKKLDKNASTIPLRPRDILVVKIVDWTDDGADNYQGYDVEVYANGAYDTTRSEVFEFGKAVKTTKEQAKMQAFAKAQAELAKGV